MLPDQLPQLVGVSEACPWAPWLGGTLARVSVKSLFLGLPWLVLESQDGLICVHAVLCQNQLFQPLLSFFLLGTGPAGPDSSLEKLSASFRMYCG